MVTGSPGGRTIINTVLQTIVNVIDFGMNAQEAVDAGRVLEDSPSVPSRVRKTRPAFLPEFGRLYEELFGRILYEH